jgi:transcriptional regulator with PAS, ATPase and Fis domain
MDDYLTINLEVKQMIKKAEKFAKTDATILIQGENGTGKEVLAQAIHMCSYRRRNLFIPINITAIAPTLLESELFGYEEGAFTGALKGGKVGLFEIASGGTIFIDEIGDAPIDFQVKLLRVLEEKRIRRVGGIEEIPVDVRIIAATNKKILKLVDEGNFREDLFFRLNILPLNTIPLRERKDDIKYLLKYFVNINFGKKKIDHIEDLFEEEALDVLENYKWRGNVRELINLVEYLSLIYEDKKLRTSSLHYYMLENKIDHKRIILDMNELWVLSEIEKNGDEGIGRTSLAMIAKNQSQNIGEGKVRRIIKDLEEKDLIKPHGNKKGNVITKAGIKVLNEYK